MAWAKLGIIAGGGELPVALAEHCKAEGKPYFVARVAPWADSALDAHAGVTQDVGEIGARIDALKAAGCDAITFVGIVKRPDFKTFKLDAGGQGFMPMLLEAAPKGDDAILRALVSYHGQAGFRIVGADDVMRALLAPAGARGAIAPSEAHLRDIARAAEVCAEIGRLDIGQAVVVCDGLVLGVEAQEGTEALLARIPALPEEIRGAPGKPRGVLLKRPKPIQERRVDLPTIGIRTVKGAIRAGLGGIAVEANGALVMQRAEMIAAADAAGMFVFGFGE